MYVLLILLFITIGVLLLVRGLTKGRASSALLGTAIILGTGLFFSLLSFLGEMLWFGSLGYGGRFWTAVFAVTGCLLAGSVAGFATGLTLTSAIPRDRSNRTEIRAIWLGGPTVGAFVGGIWGWSNWDTVLKYLNRLPAGVDDPIFGRDASFYLFSLPMYDSLFWMFLTLSSVALAVALVCFFKSRTAADASQPSLVALIKSLPQGGHQAIADRLANWSRNWKDYRGLLIPMAAFTFVLAWGTYLASFHLMFSEWGVVTGPGWTDVKIRLPAYYIVSIVTALVGVGLLIPALSRGAFDRLRKRRPGEVRFASLLATPVIAVGTAWFLLLFVVPSFVQWIYVEPNEITVEKPYITHNIRFTRQGFQLDKVEEREFKVSDQLTTDAVTNNQGLLSEVRLWDPRALDSLYKQFQEIRLYYEFIDVDIDRYTLGGKYRQVMVAPRELELNNLPEQSRTFVNRRIKYTHGHGLTLATVSDFSSDGLPNLLVKDIPSRSVEPELTVERPEIYYGELTIEHVIVNTTEDEFDYPSGDQNVYCQYAGNGGVPVTNLWRKLLFGWKFDGTRLMFSTYLTPSSRIMFHRQIRERVDTLAPFLRFDEDPYMVVHEGKLYWIVDAYATSDYYPYSQHFRGRDVSRHLHGSNYARNSVKAVVDAYEGSVTLYIFEPDDPLIQVWAKVFPNLFKKREEMPAPLRSHVRYPEELLLAQGMVYAKYHMTDPAVFYNQEDLWVRATEKYYTKVQRVEPYYIMWKPPGSKRAEFVLIQPFTPKDKQVMIGWIAGLCDGENYGRLLAYRFPKEKRVLGPQQVETKIDQDRFLSGQLTLWDQRGSQVIRGNLLAIPLDDTLLYVEPIYLQAESAAYPELRLVAVMHGDKLSYADTFDDALAGLFDQNDRGVASRPLGTESVARGTVQELVQQASEAFENYLRLQGKKQFTEAAEELKGLADTLEQLRMQTQTPQPTRAEVDAQGDD